tara:strand:+ start:34279 stop:34890 length:612 start_codon:yes stop_codon:yes gene_type:complete
VKPDQWLVVTDVDGAPDIPDWAQHVQLSGEVGKVSTFDPSNRSLAIALDMVPSDHAAVIIEDDDWYPADYIKSRIDAVEKGAEIAGNRTEKRYHLPGRLWHIAHKAMPNAGCCVLGPTIPRRFSSWLQDPRSQRSFWDFFHRDFDLPVKRVSIKGAGYGLPGRAGGTHKIGEHHKKWVDDLGDFEMLRCWLGQDADDYIKLLT